MKKQLASIGLPLVLTTLAMTEVRASSFVGFETAGPNLATDGLVLTDQFRAAQGIRFSRADGGAVTVARTGSANPAFDAGPDTAARAGDGTLLAGDPWRDAAGECSVRLAGQPASALVIDYDQPTALVAGLLLDVDPDEVWVVRGYRDSGITLVAEAVLTGGTPGTGDRVATPWALSRETADIRQIRILQTGANANARAALDLFHPRGTFARSSAPIALSVRSRVASSLTLGVDSIPGVPLRLESASDPGFGPWTLERVLNPSTASSDASLVVEDAAEFFRAVTAETGRAAQIQAAAEAFLGTLTAAQRASVVYAAGNLTQRARWSNFPTGIFQRNGLKIGSMTTEQIDALWALLATVLSPEGYLKVRAIVAGDQVLRSQTSGGNLIFGTAEYYITFVGEPSVAGKYLIQFGGHHLALNITVQGAQATIAPALPGVQPGTYTEEGRTVRPLGDEYDLSFALLNSMSSEQRAAAVLSASFADLALGPGKDGVTLLPEGIKASALTVAQRSILLDLIGRYVNIVHDEASETKMASVRAKIADPDQATYFSWRGPTTPGSAAYFRVQGPNLFIEFSPQSMGGSAVNHIHAMYRELANDYGAQITP